MIENLAWLFWAYAAGWGLIFGYLVWVSRRERSLRRRMQQLRELLEQEWEQRKA